MKKYKSIAQFSTLFLVLIITCSWNSCLALEITNQELASLTEALFTLEEENNAASFIVLNKQDKTSNQTNIDVAPNPLITLNTAVYFKPTISKLISLHDNYITNVCSAENLTSSEQAEEISFLEAIWATPVMNKTQEFMREKGIGSAIFKDNFKNLWFNFYSRCSGSGNRTLGSSGIEHVFLGEIRRDSEVLGLHNWIFFARQEEETNLDYKGWSNFIELGNKGWLIEFSMNWLGIDKKSNSMFVGTSPELELALYTICFLAKPNALCPISLGGKSFSIQTYFDNSTGYVASAYPDLSTFNNSSALMTPSLKLLVMLILSTMRSVLSIF